jgi:hypothetical protein
MSCAEQAAEQDADDDSEQAAKQHADGDSGGKHNNQSNLQLLALHNTSLVAISR